VKYLKWIILSLIVIVPLCNLIWMRSSQNQDLTSKEEVAPLQPPTSVTSSMPEQASNQKTMTMIFDKYEEGDYFHTIFLDESTGESYDFMYKNDLSGLAPDDLYVYETAEAGYTITKANPKFLGKKFTVVAAFQKVKSSDLNGNVIEVDGWVIKSIKAQ
jgi:hypothetical protein